MPAGIASFPSNADTPAAVTIPPSQVVGSATMVLTPSRADWSPAQIPLAVPPMTSTSVDFVWEMGWVNASWLSAIRKKGIKKMDFMELISTLK